LKKLTLVAFALTLLAGCASNDGVQVASREESYTPLGTLLPRKTNQGKDERTYIDKEEFKRAQETVSSMAGAERK
jgi:hypothetical protein